MQENGRMNWLEQIHQMKNRDIRTIEQSELEELPQDAVEHGLPQEERLKNLLDTVGIFPSRSKVSLRSSGNAVILWEVLQPMDTRRTPVIIPS